MAKSFICRTSSYCMYSDNAQLFHNIPECVHVYLASYPGRVGRERRSGIHCLRMCSQFCNSSIILSYCMVGNFCGYTFSRDRSKFRFQKFFAILIFTVSESRLAMVQLKAATGYSKVVYVQRKKELQENNAHSDR